MNHMLEQTMHLAAANPFISGGASVAVLAFCMNWLKSLPTRLYKSITDYLLTTVLVDDNSNLYVHLNRFMALECKYYKHSSAYLNISQKQPVVVFHSNDGTTKWIRFQNGLLHLSKKRPRNGANKGGTETGLSNIINMYKPDHYLITCFSLDRDLPRKFLEHVVHEEVEAVTKIDIFSNKNDSWHHHGAFPLRALSSVVSNNDMLEDILQDTKQFRESQDRYTNLGIPYHRGYLLSGPPGNGKTSIIHAIASELKASIVILDISSVRDDGELAHLLSTIGRVVLVIEDIDCLFVQRAAEKTINVSFSGLLNALDGLMSSNGQVVFMTTNHPELLDPALIRRGRVDRIFEIENATREQASRLFTRFFPDATDSQATQFSRHMPDKTLSMAAIQGHLLNYESDMHSAIANVHEIIGELVPA